jgi:hypothetical protein
MKVTLIILAILSGWLFSEMKDFIMNGGYDNKLATILLKIVFILVGILICALFDFNYEKYFQPKEKHETPSTPPPEFETNKSVRSRSNSRGRRSQVKPIDFNVYSD